LLTYRSGLLGSAPRWPCTTTRITVEEFLTIETKSQHIALAWISARRPIRVGPLWPIGRSWFKSSTISYSQIIP